MYNIPYSTHITLQNFKEFRLDLRCQSRTPTESTSVCISILGHLCPVCLFIVQHLCRVLLSILQHLCVRILNRKFEIKLIVDLLNTFHIDGMHLVCVDQGCHAWTSSVNVLQTVVSNQIIGLRNIMASDAIWAICSLLVLCSKWVGWVNGTISSNSSRRVGLHHDVWYRKSYCIWSTLASLRDEQYEITSNADLPVFRMLCFFIRCFCSLYLRRVV